jgi:hypothetical protein
MDTTNWQLVGVRGEDVAVQAPKRIMTREQALLHAAWLVVMAGDDDQKFTEILQAVRNT